MEFSKPNVSLHEYTVHQQAWAMQIVPIPKVLSYDPLAKTMVMQRIDGMNLSDMFGESASDVPEELLLQVQNIIQELRAHHIQYIDLTGYNFVLEEATQKVWIIDFEHAVFDDEHVPEVVREFCESNVGELKWNPNFQ